MSPRKITIYVPQEVVIPGERIESLKASWCDRWGLDADSHVSDAELLTEAEEEGVIELPEGWKL